MHCCNNLVGLTLANMRKLVQYLVTRQEPNRVGLYSIVTGALVHKILHQHIAARRDVSLWHLMDIKCLKFECHDAFSLRNTFF